MAYPSPLISTAIRLLTLVGGERTPEALAQALACPVSQLLPLLEDAARQGLVHQCSAVPLRYGLLSPQPRTDIALAAGSGSPWPAIFIALDEGSLLTACESIIKHIEDLLDHSRAAGAVLCLELALMLLGALNPRASVDARRLVNLALAAADMSMYLTKFHQETRLVCQAARTAAQTEGDVRSMALLQLVEACLENMAAECRPNDIQALRARCEESLRDLGDSDFLAQASYFMGMFDFWQGNFLQVLHSFETAQRLPQLWQSRFQKEMFPLYTSSSALYLGRLHQAVGILEAARRTAELTQDAFKTMWWEAQLALVLLYMGRDEEALELLDHVIGAANPESETKILHWGMRGLAYYHYRKGNLRASHMVMQDTMRVSQANGFRRLPYSNPWIFDMLAAYELAGLPPIAGFTLDEEMERTLAGCNQHLRAAALRAKALRLRATGAPADAVKGVLRESLQTFSDVGNAREVARTRALLNASLTPTPCRQDSPQTDGLPAASRDARLPAVVHASGVPDLREEMPETAAAKILENNCRLALHSVHFLQGLPQFANQMTYIASCELGAERAALVRSEDNGAVRVEASCNMSDAELHSGHLASRLARLLSALGGTPLLLEEPERTALILPLPVDENARWVLYMESTYAVHTLQSIDQPTQKTLQKLFAEELRTAFRLQRAQAASTGDSPELARTEPYQDSPQALLHGSPITRRVLSHARQIATTEATVLILGETGVGKELLARYIHDCSGRPGAFVPVHPASIPDGLFESEFFGHEKGSFTGAHKRKIGLAELAHKGTLFIDEVGDIPPPMQVKLLRVFQNQRFLRVGGNAEIYSEFRLVGATNKDLWQEVQEGRFREDLYYRMSVVPLTLPPLRERREDIGVLTQLFLDRYSRRYGRTIPLPSEADMEVLLAYPWMGNVRELKSVVERAVILHREGPLHFDLAVHGHGAAHRASTGMGGAENGNASRAQGKATGVAQSDALPHDRDTAAPASLTEDWPTMETLEARYIRRVLDRTNGRITGPRGALKILDMKRSTLYARMKQYGIS